MFEFEELVYLIFSIGIISVILYIGFVFGRIKDNAAEKEMSNIFKKTFHRK